MLRTVLNKQLRTSISSERQICAGCDPPHPRTASWHPPPTSANTRPVQPQHCIPLNAVDLCMRAGVGHGQSQGRNCHRVSHGQKSRCSGSSKPVLINNLATTRTFLGMSGNVLTTSQSCLTPYTRASAPPTAMYSPLWSNATADAPVPARARRRWFQTGNDDSQHLGAYGEFRKIQTIHSYLSQLL